MELLRFHEIAEQEHRILNPLSPEKLALLGDICAPVPHSRHLDLACGKGEMLCQWARRWGTRGTGVDLSPLFLAAARARAGDLGVEVDWVEGDAAGYAGEGAFDLVSCIGATWIGGGLSGTLALMKRFRKPDALLLVGECYWLDPPPQEAYAVCGIAPGDFTTLVGTMERCQASGLEVVEMVQASRDDFDRYVAPQWRTVDRWLRQHPHHPWAEPLRAWNDRARSAYLTWERRYLGWTTLVLR